MVNGKDTIIAWQHGNEDAADEEGDVEGRVFCYMKLSEKQSEGIYAYLGYIEAESIKLILLCVDEELKNHAKQHCERHDLEQYLHRLREYV